MISKDKDVAISFVHDIDIPTKEELNEDNI